MVSCCRLTSYCWLPGLGEFFQLAMWVFLLVPRPSWGSRSQLMAPSGPSPQTLPSHHHWGGKEPRTQKALRLLRPPKWEPDLMDYYPWRPPLPLGSGGGDGGEAFCFKALAWSVGSCGAGSGALQDTALSLSPAHSQAQGLRVPGRKLWSTRSTSHDTLPHGTLRAWQNGTSNRHANGCGLMVAC